MADLVEKFKGKCFTCEEYKIHDKGDSDRRGYRCSHHHRTMAHFESCSSYEFDKYRTSAEIDEAYDWIYKYRSYEPKYDNTYWYIVTAATRIMGLPDDNIFMQSAIEFRNFIKQDEKNKKLLVYYEMYGLPIAEKMLLDYENKNMEVSTKNLVEMVLIPNYLTKFSEFVINKDYDNALNVYKNMMFFLSGYYNQIFYLTEISEEKLNGKARSLKKIGD